MLRSIRRLLLSILLALGLFMAVDSMIARNYVDGPSMEPTLHKDQVLMISRIGISGFTRQVYATTHQEEQNAASGLVPPRGAICTFIHPKDPTRTLIKRVVGLPGEIIVIRDGVVSADGKPLSEPYVVFHDQRSMAALRVPKDAIFFLGDNRPDSSDSRVFGPVPRANLLGVALLRYWPLPDFRLLLPNR